MNWDQQYAHTDMYTHGYAGTKLIGYPVFPDFIGYILETYA